MAQQNPSRHTLWSLSIVMLSLGVAIGTLAAVWVLGPARMDVDSRVADFLDLPPNAIHASATHGIDNFAVATGLLDDQTEAIYFLDFVTGELKGAGISRQSNKFTSLYRRKILQDFKGLERGDDAKNPRFLLVTGIGSLQQRGSRGRLAKSLIYVVEVNSGQAVVYAAPETKSTRATGTPSAHDLIPIDKLSLRKRGSVRPGSGN